MDNLAVYLKMHCALHYQPYPEFERERWYAATLTHPIRVAYLGKYFTTFSEDPKEDMRVDIGTMCVSEFAPKLPHHCGSIELKVLKT